jgi:mannose-6-phosphate isomerase-like protein (cupin superfamily)
VSFCCDRPYGAAYDLDDSHDPHRVFHARPGHGGPLAERLLHAAWLVVEAPGCELWLVHRDGEDPDTVRVSDMWVSHTQRAAALDAPGVAENASQVMELLDRPPDVVDGDPLGGARGLRGTTGATAFSILDAPDLSKDTSLRDRYELAEVGEARDVRLTHDRLRPGRRQGWAHGHRVAEEIYVALSGTGRTTVDDDAFELQPLEAVRVAPGSTRELDAGPQGLEVLAFGSQSPRDGEMVADRQRA